MSKLIKQETLIRKRRMKRHDVFRKRSIHKGMIKDIGTLMDLAANAQTEEKFERMVELMMRMK